jgi:hypothetical protein
VVVYLLAYVLLPVVVLVVMVVQEIVVATAKRAYFHVRRCSGHRRASGY